MASRRVVMEIITKVIMDIDEGEEVSDIVDNLDYSIDPDERATVVDTEIVDYTIKDSR